MEISLTLLAGKVYQIFCDLLLWRGNSEYSSPFAILVTAIKGLCKNVSLAGCVSPRFYTIGAEFPVPVTLLDVQVP